MALRNTQRLHQHKGHKLTVHPAEEPVTVDDLKAHLRISGASEDTYLDTLITEARQAIENQLGTAMVSQTWELALDSWGPKADPWWDGVRQGSLSEIFSPSETHSVTMPRFPLASITSIKTYDEDSNETSVTVADTFDVDTYRVPGRITLKRGSTWPVATRANNSIIVAYVAGYGAATAVPSVLKRAVIQLASYLYSHRGDGCSAGEAFTDSGVRTLLRPYEVKEV